MAESWMAPRRAEQQQEPCPEWWPVEYAAQFPYWHVWEGVAGLKYARRLMSSPPRVVRALTTDSLKAAIVESEAARVGRRMKAAP